ncbi:MAG TPA: molybdate ABC transporter substrate-binding protein [Burkholderiales bacterium]|nr:molybdate ABC transporter substrate-binding protein [Burkholderiales bacterium]
MSLAGGAAQSAEIVVFSTISAKEALIELVPEFERESGHKINITYAGGSGLADRIRDGTRGDLFIGPEEFSDPLIAEGKLLAGSRTAFARSTTGLAVRAGAPRPDISSPEKLKSALLAARSVSYSTGASGMHFVKVLERLGIADAVAAKRIAPRAGELVGAVVARGEADIGVQQLSELLPVSGIEILDPLPAELQQTIVYGATAFPQATQRQAAQAFVGFLRSETARAVLRKKGLDPA